MLDQSKLYTMFIFSILGLLHIVSNKAGVWDGYFIWMGGPKSLLAAIFVYITSALLLATIPGENVAG
jgi:hypothetical protein